MKYLIIILSVHIFSVHAKLLYYLNPELVEKTSFSFANLSEPSILAMVFALSYSLATAVVIYNTENKRIIATYALLDGVAVLLYYFTKLPMFLSAFYFAIYTFILIGSTITIKKPITMFDMQKAGATLKEIAEKFKVSESTISRKLNGKNSKSNTLRK